MRNYLSDGDIVTRTTPLGGCVSGVPFILGSEFLVPVSTAAAGVDVACVREGKVRLPAKSGEVWTAGTKVYWHTTNGNCEATDSANNVLIGTAEGPQSAAHEVDVILPGLPLATGGDYDQKADKAVPAAAGNLAGLTAGGNLEDSGLDPDDIALTDDLPAADGTTLTDVDGTWSVDSTLAAGAAAGATAVQPDDIEDMVTTDSGGLTDGNLAVWDGVSNKIKDGGPVPTSAAREWGAVNATQAMSLLAVTRVGSSTGTCVVTGTPKRSGTLRIEITVSGEADGGIAKCKYSFRGEALSADLDVTTTGTALGDSGLTATFTNGAPLSFEDGDYWTGTSTIAATVNEETFAVTADLVTPAGTEDEIVVTNSRIQVGSEVLCGGRNGTSTVGGAYLGVSQGGAGTASLHVINMGGGGAFNGTVVAVCEVLNPNLGA